MENQPQNPEFRINPENFQPMLISYITDQAANLLQYQNYLDIKLYLGKCIAVSDQTAPKLSSLIRVYTVSV